MPVGTVGNSNVAVVVALLTELEELELVLLVVVDEEGMDVDNALEEFCDVIGTTVVVGIVVGIVVAMVDAGCGVGLTVSALGVELNR